MVQPLWKMMEWKSLGMMTFPTEGNVIKKKCSKPPTSYDILQHVTIINPLYPIKQCSKTCVVPVYHLVENEIPRSLDCDNPKYIGDYWWV